MDVIIQSWHFRRVGISFTEAISSCNHINISAGTGSLWNLCRPVGMWCDAALSRTVRKIFSSLWQSVGISNDNSLQVPTTTAYKWWNCQVFRPANCCQLILPNRFLDGFPDPSQFAAAKLTHYSSKPQRPSDSS